MTLEDRLDALTAALTATTAALTAVAGLASGGAAAAPAAAAAEKPATKTAAEKKKEKEAAAANAGSEDAVVSKEATDAVLAWLGEFAKEEDKGNPEGVHPEVTARREALKKAYTGLKVTKLGEVKGEAEVARFTEWFEKAKAVDKGHGVGRFVADPEPAAEDDGMGI